jgi:phosphate starvation-inducible protein PhoH
VYQLSRGNMFIIRIGEDWTPIVSQLTEQLDEHATQQTALDRFKSIFRNDPSIQELELY